MFSLKMKSVANLVLCLILFGCSPSHVRFKEDLKIFSSNDITKFVNILFIGEAFPNGRKLKLSDLQAKTLQGILSHSKYEQRNLPIANHGEYFMVSPDPTMCFLSIAGKTWYFMPPADPHMFRLPSEQQKQFEYFLAEEFELR